MCAGSQARVDRGMRVGEVKWPDRRVIEGKEGGQDSGAEATCAERRERWPGIARRGRRDHARMLPGDRDATGRRIERRAD